MIDAVVGNAENYKITMTQGHKTVVRFSLHFQSTAMSFFQSIKVLALQD